MRNIWLILVTLCLAFSASSSFGAKAKKKTRSKKRPNIQMSQKYVQKAPAKKQKSKIGINIYSFFSAADRLNTTTNSNYNATTGSTDTKPTASLTGTYEASTAVGLGLEYSKPSLFNAGPVGFGISAGGSYEFNRSVNRKLVRNFGTTNSANTIVDTAGDPTFDLVLPYLNATVNYGQTYIYGGVNYSIPQFSNASDEEYAGKVGFQAGFGSKINDWIAVEASYRVVNFDAKPDFSEFISSNRSFNIRNIDVEARKGLGIIEDESLDLTGFMLTLKFSI